MILIEYGEQKELFAAESPSVPDAIKELYSYVSGRIDKATFYWAIDGITKYSIDKAISFYNALAFEKPIHQIFTGANQYWRADNDRKRP